MKHLHCYIVSPLNGRYSNKKKIQDKELILNTSIEDHKFVNRIGTIIETPINGSMKKIVLVIFKKTNIFAITIKYFYIKEIINGILQTGLILLSLFRRMICIA